MLVVFIKLWGLLSLCKFTMLNHQLLAEATQVMLSSSAALDKVALVQHSTAQHSTAQHSTAQHSIA